MQQQPPLAAAWEARLRVAGVRELVLRPGGAGASGGPRLAAASNGRGPTALGQFEGISLDFNVRFY